MRVNSSLNFTIDETYKLVKRKVPNIMYPCYGGCLSWMFLNYSREALFFYLTDSSILYTQGGGRINEIPFADIKKISVSHSRIMKSVYHIRLTSDKKYHFYLYSRPDISTELTGDSTINVSSFIDKLKRSTYNGEKD